MSTSKTSTSRRARTSPSIAATGGVKTTNKVKAPNVKGKMAGISAARINVNAVKATIRAQQQIEREMLRRERHKKQLLDSMTSDDHILLEVAAEIAHATSPNTHLFHVTDKSGDLHLTLYRIFLAGLPVRLRDTYRCNTCRHFFERYGDLVTINDDGSLTSWLWKQPAQYPRAFDKAIRAVKAEVERGIVTGQFISREGVLGVAKTGPWEHFAVINPAPWTNLARNDNEAAADKRTDYDVLSRSLQDFNRSIAKKAITILSVDNVLFRQEKVKGVAQWFSDLHEAIAHATGNGRRANSKRRHHLIWAAVASAPAGWAHVRTSMIGTLLEDLANGLSVKDCAKKFEAKMHPLQYQRPQVYAQGTVVAAEKLVEKMGIARSLERRYATMDDLPGVGDGCVWTNTRDGYTHYTPSEPTGVFAHLKVENVMASGITLPDQTMTWEKFARTILPDVVSMDMLTREIGNYVGLTAAVYDDAPPIIQWDSDGCRNTVSLYVYTHGSSPEMWGLCPRTWVRVNGVYSRPHEWYGREHLFTNHKNGIILVLEGAKDVRNTSLCLFPEILRSDLHAVRSVIEAHSNNSRLQGEASANANGYTFGVGGMNIVYLRVLLKNGAIGTFEIDRWD